MRPAIRHCVRAWAYQARRGHERTPRSDGGKALSRAGLAKLLGTARTQVNRLLDPSSDVTICSLQRSSGGRV
jgi:hypothetical protein